MIEMHPFQDKLFTEAREAVRKHRSVLLQLYPGGGKTVIAAFMAKSALEKGLRVWFVCHRSELIFQTAKTFKAVGLDFGYIAAGYDPQQAKKIQICSIDTLRNRLDSVIPPDFMIFDECHHQASKTWDNVKNHFNVPCVGLSGTPHRLDGKGLSKNYNHMVCGPDVKWLIKNGYLSSYRYFNPSQPDVSGIHKLAGDYKKDEIDMAMSTNAITGNVIDHYKKHALGKRTILFATSIERSKLYAEQFQNAGIMAAHIDGTTASSLRRAMSFALASDDIKVLCNVALFGEGYDLSAQAGKDCPIQCVIDCQPTMSLARWLQMVMRCMRSQEGDAIIFDHSGNCWKHGLPNEDREWSLEGAEKSKKKSDEPDIINRQCPECYAVHPFRPSCPECGHIYQTQPRKVDEVAGELNEVNEEKFQRMRKRKKEQGKAQTIDELIELGKRRGYKSPKLERWAGYVFTARQAKQRKYAEAR